MPIPHLKQVSTYLYFSRVHRLNQSFGCGHRNPLEADLEMRRVTPEHIAFLARCLVFLPDCPLHFLYTVPFPFLGQCPVPNSHALFAGIAIDKSVIGRLPSPAHFGNYISHSI